MVEITKEVVLDWYQGLNASHRVELMCALLEHSLPFELRLFGTIIENLGRKDFHILREADIKANSLHTSSDSSPNVEAIVKMLSEGPVPSNLAISSQMVSNQAHQPGGHSHSAAGASNEPPPAASKAGDRMKSYESTGNANENGLPSSKSSSPALSSSGPDEGGKGPELSNHIGEHSEEENDSKKDFWLNDGVKRRKLILYLSLMKATNHDSANLYYRLLSHVEDQLLENLDWLEDLEELVQDEIILLYTASSRHPAFNFEQRAFLASVSNRLKECTSKSKDRNGVVSNHCAGLPPQYFAPFFYCPPPHLVPSGQTPSGTAYATEGVRPAASPVFYSLYPGGPVYAAAHPQLSSNNPLQQQQYQNNVYHMGAVASTIQPTGGSQSPTTPASTASTPNSSNQIDGSSSKGQVQSPPPGPQSRSHQSSVSASTRTSSMATALQSQPNSVDGDSECSFENCAWDSPESSPFESPPQSLTPSRSQSPNSKQTVHVSKTAVGTSSNDFSNTQLRSTPMVSKQEISQPAIVENYANVNSAGAIVQPKLSKKINQRATTERQRQTGGPSTPAGQMAGGPNTPGVTSITITTVTTTTTSHHSAAVSPPLLRSSSNVQHLPPSTNMPMPSHMSQPSAVSSTGCDTTARYVSPSFLLNASSTTPVISSAYSAVSSSAFSNSINYPTSIPHHFINKPVTIPLGQYNNQQFYNGTHSAGVVNSQYIVKSGPVKQLQPHGRSQKGLHPSAPISQTSPNAVTSPPAPLLLPPFVPQGAAVGGPVQHYSTGSSGGTHVVNSGAYPAVSCTFNSSGFPSQDHMSNQSIGNPLVGPYINTVFYNGSHPPPSSTNANYPQKVPGVLGGRQTNATHTTQSPSNNVISSGKPHAHGLPHFANLGGPADPVQSHNAPSATHAIGIVNSTAPYVQSPMGLNGPSPGGPSNSTGAFTGYQPHFASATMVTPGTYRPNHPLPVFARPTNFMPNGFPNFTTVDSSLPPGIEDPVDISCQPRKISCYNCGSNKHIGPECKELSMEEATKVQYRLNYGGENNEGE